MSEISKVLTCAAIAALMSCTALGSVAVADPLALVAQPPHHGSIFDVVLRDQAAVQGPVDSSSDVADPSARLQRQMVGYQTREAPGTIIIDTPSTYLYLVLGGGKAMRYGIGVGREGFTWSGVETIVRKAEWPDWSPPAEMLQRQPYLPRVMAGGPGNPLGARALYLGSTAYRIHGTNQPSTIGHHVSSGCIRMLNEDVTDLYARVSVGAKVVVLPTEGPRAALTHPVRPASTPSMVSVSVRHSSLY